MKKNGTNLALFFVAAFISSGSSFAESLIPHVFTAGTPAKAEEVNENFAAVADEMGNISQGESELRAALDEIRDQVDGQDLSLADLDVRVQVLEEAAEESAPSLAYDFPDYVWSGGATHLPGDVVSILGGTMTIGGYDLSNIISSQSSLGGASVYWPIEFSIPNLAVYFHGAYLSTSVAGLQGGDAVYNSTKQSKVTIDGSKVVYSNVLYNYLNVRSGSPAPSYFSDSVMFVSVEIAAGIWLYLRWKVEMYDDGFALNDVVTVRNAILDSIRVIK